MRAQIRGVSGIGHGWLRIIFAGRKVFIKVL